MELDLIVPDVEPNNNTSKDTKCPSPTSLVTTKIVGSSSATAHCANSASVKVGNMLTVNSSPSMSPAAVAAGSQCSVVNVTSRGLVPSMMIRPVVTLAPSSTGNALMLPQFVPIRPTSHTRQTNLQLPTVQVTPSVQMQAVPTNSKTLTLLPKTHVVQSTSTSGLPLPVVNVQITGSQHQQTQQQQTVQHPHQAQMTSSAHQGTHPAVTVVKLPPGTDIEALTTTAAASSVSQSSGSDSRGKAGQFWQYVCGDCPYSTSDYKLYKRHRSAAHDTSNMQTKVGNQCNRSNRRQQVMFWDTRVSLDQSAGLSIISV